MIDSFGNELEVGMIVLQDRRKDRSTLRDIVEIDEERHPDQVRLGLEKNSHLSEITRGRATWVNRYMVTKWCNQGEFNV